MKELLTVTSNIVATLTANELTAGSGNLTRRRTSIRPRPNCIIFS